MYYIIKDDVFYMASAQKELLYGQGEIKKAENISFNDYYNNPQKYKVFKNKLIVNPQYNEEQAQLESERRMQEIKTELYELDLEAIRPLRAILAGTQTDEDLEKIKEIETKAKELRIKIQPLKSL